MNPERTDPSIPGLVPPFPADLVQPAPASPARTPAWRRWSAPIALVAAGLVGGSLVGGMLYADASPATSTPVRVTESLSGLSLPGPGSLPDGGGHRSRTSPDGPISDTGDAGAAQPNEQWVPQRAPQSQGTTGASG